MHICISANMHLCINVDMHICIYAYMYTHKHHLAHIISFCMDSPTHLDNTISVHMHKQMHTHIEFHPQWWNYEHQNSFFGSISSSRSSKMGHQGPTGSPEGIHDFLENSWKKVSKNICVFSAKVSCDTLRLTPERRDTYDGRKKLIHQPRRFRKVGKKGVIIDVKITKHQYLHDFRNDRVT